MRLVLLFFGISALFLLSWAIWGSGWEDRFTLDGAVAWLRGADTWAWVAGLGFLVADVILPMPRTVIMSALGYMYGTWIGGLMAATGSCLAGMTGYAICRALGERTAQRLLGERDFSRGEVFFRKGGGWVVALSRALPILPEAIACTAGLVRMPFGRFVLALFCGALPTGLLFAWIGAAGREKPSWAIAWSLLVPAVLWGMARWIQRLIRRKGQVTPAD